MSLNSEYDLGRPYLDDRMRGDLIRLEAKRLNFLTQQFPDVMVNGYCDILANGHFAPVEGVRVHYAQPAIHRIAHNVTGELAEFQAEHGFVDFSPFERGSRPLLDDYTFSGPDFGHAMAKGLSIPAVDLTTGLKQNNEVIAEVREGKRHNQLGVLFLLIDQSVYMGDKQKEVAKAVIHWNTLWLRLNYPLVRVHTLTYASEATLVHQNLFSWNNKLPGIPRAAAAYRACLRQAVKYENPHTALHVLQCASGAHILDEDKATRISLEELSTKTQLSVAIHAAGVDQRLYERMRYYLGKSDSKQFRFEIVGNRKNLPRMMKRFYGEKKRGKNGTIEESI